MATEPGRVLTDRAGGPSRAKIVPAITNSIRSRFLTKVAQAFDECQVWCGARSRDGYGQFSIGGELFAAHRIALAMVGKDLTSGQVVDHKCRNKACVNPAHLRLVSYKENNRENGGANQFRVSQTACLRGHSLDGENLYIKPDGARRCRKCKRAADAAFRQRKRSNG